MDGGFSLREGIYGGGSLYGVLSLHMQICFWILTHDQLAYQMAV